jgi:hypothetical protein
MIGSDDQLQFRVSLDGASSLSEGFRGGERSVKSFTGTIGQELRRAGSEIASFASTTARALAGLTGAGAGLGIAAQAKGVLELRDAVDGLGATAGLTDEQIDSLRGKLLETAKATNVFAKDMNDALSQFVAKTGDIEKGTKNLELWGKVARATRSEAKEIAAVAADLEKLKIDDQANAFAILAKQSDVGSVELKDLVSQGPRLLSAFMGAGLSGEKGLREGGAMAQVFQKGTGNVERTSTAVEAAFRDIAEKADVIEGAGIKVKGRDRVEVLLDVIRKAKGDEFQLRRIKGDGIFGDEAMRGVNMLASEFRATGGFPTFESFRDVAGDPALLNAKFRTNTRSTVAKMRQAQIEMEASADRNMGNSLDRLGGAAAGFLPGAFDVTTSHPLLAGGGALAGMLGLRVGGRLLASRLGLGGGGGGAAGALGAALGGAAGAIPVTVTNWPAGFGGGLAGGSPLGGAGALGELGKGGSKDLAGMRQSKVNGGGKLLGALKLLGAFGVGFGMGEALDDTFGISDDASAQMRHFFGADERDQESVERGAASHRGMLAAKSAQRELRVRELMAERGLTRGQALFLADHPEGESQMPLGVLAGGTSGGQATFRESGVTNPLELLKAMGLDSLFEGIADRPLNLTINLSADGEASVGGDTGTRSATVRVRRTTGNG